MLGVQTGRVPRRVLFAMIATGCLLTVLSFTLHFDAERLKSKLDGFLARATSATTGVEVRPR